MRASLGRVPSCFMAQFDVGRPISRVSRCLRDVSLTMTHSRRRHKSSSSWPLFNRRCTTYARNTTDKIAQFSCKTSINVQRSILHVEGDRFYFNRAIPLADRLAGREIWNFYSRIFFLTNRFKFSRKINLYRFFGNSLNLLKNCFSRRLILKSFEYLLEEEKKKMFRFRNLWRRRIVTFVPSILAAHQLHGTFLFLQLAQILLQLLHQPSLFLANLLVPSVVTIRRCANIHHDRQNNRKSNY